MQHGLGLWQAIILSLSQVCHICQRLRIEDTPLMWDQRDALTGMVLKYHDVFMLDNSELGTTHLVEHVIDTGANSPCKQYARRMPHSLHGRVKDLLKDMLDRNVIVPSQSPWSSPMVFVKKKNDFLRCCVDYRKLNALTKMGIFPSSE